MSALTLQEILLAATFLLTVINIGNGWNASRAAKARQLTDDPKIIKMHTDIEYIRMAVDSQADIIRQRTSNVDRDLQDMRERLVRLEATNTKEERV